MALFRIKIQHALLQRLAAAAIFFLLLTSLCGCQLSGLSAESLMRPPKAAGDGATIQKAMEDELGVQITLRYPRRGEYRSAVVRADVDNDGQQEAIAFYRTATETSGARMIVLDTNDSGRWSVIGEADSTGGDIERIMFGDLDGDGSLEIITGWSLYSDTTRIITAHACSGGSLTALSISSPDDPTGLAAFTSMVVGDFNGDNRDDILAVLLNSAEGSATARLYCLRATATQPQILPEDGVRLDASTVTYVSSQAGMLTNHTFGLVIDSYRSDGSYATELVYWDADLGRLVAPLNDPETAACSFFRSQNVASTDINGDGIIELPRDSLLPGYSASDPSPLYLTEWYRYLPGSDILLVTTGLMRTDDGYYFAFDEAWIGEITAQRDPLKSIVYFYLSLPYSPFSIELMRIKVFTLDEWQDEDPWVSAEVLTDTEEVVAPRYMGLSTTDYYVYGILIADGNRMSGISYEAIADNFYLLP